MPNQLSLPRSATPAPCLDAPRVLFPTSAKSFLLALVYGVQSGGADVSLFLTTASHDGNPCEPPGTTGGHELRDLSNSSVHPGVAAG